VQSAMKKPKPIEIHEDRPTTARRRSRNGVGIVAPTRVLTPKTLRAPRHKKRDLEDNSA